MRVLGAGTFVLVAAACTSTTTGHSVHSSEASTASSSTSSSVSASSAVSTTQAGGGGGGGGGGSVTTPRSSSNAPVPTSTNKPSPTTPVTSIAGIKATFNNPAFAHVSGTYTCTSGTGNLLLGLTHQKNGVPNEYDGPNPGAALNCNGASVAFGPTTLTLDGGNDMWNNHDPVTVQVIFKFADGSSQEQSASVMATG